MDHCPKQWSSRLGVESTFGCRSRTGASISPAATAMVSTLKLMAVLSSRRNESLRTVWSPAEQGRLESALQAIDVAKCGYEDFLKIGFALHSLNWDRPDGTSIGFDLWDRWCSRSQHCPQRLRYLSCQSQMRPCSPMSQPTMSQPSMSQPPPQPPRFPPLASITGAAMW